MMRTNNRGGFLYINGELIASILLPGKASLP